MKTPKKGISCDKSPKNAMSCEVFLSQLWHFFGNEAARACFLEIHFRKSRQAHVTRQGIAPQDEAQRQTDA